MKNGFIGLVVAVLVAGCATPPPKVWQKEGSTAEQFRRDQMSCRQYGMQSATANGLAGNMFVGMWINDETVKCLSGLGYQ